MGKSVDELHNKIQELEDTIASQQSTIASQQRILEERFESPIGPDSTVRVGWQGGCWAATLCTEYPDVVDMWPNYDTVQASQEKLHIRISRITEGGNSKGRGNASASKGRGDAGEGSGLGDGGTRGRKRARSPDVLVDAKMTAMKTDHFVLVAGGHKLENVQWLRPR